MMSVFSLCSEVQDLERSSSCQGRFYVGAGGAQAPQMLARPPQIFWFQQQKYALLKSTLFLYSGEINTRIN